MGFSVQQVFQRRSSGGRLFFLVALQYAVFLHFLQDAGDGGHAQGQPLGYFVFRQPLVLIKQPVYCLAVMAPYCGRIIERDILKGPARPYKKPVLKAQKVLKGFYKTEILMNGKFGINSLTSIFLEAL